MTRKQFGQLLAGMCSGEHQTGNGKSVAFDLVRICWSDGASPDQLDESVRHVFDHIKQKGLNLEYDVDGDNWSLFYRDLGGVRKELSNA